MTKFKGHGIFHIRTCQECGHEQSDKLPREVTDKWLEKKCARCKSEALDYGSEREYKNGVEVEPNYDEE